MLFMLQIVYYKYITCYITWGGHGLSGLAFHSREYTFQILFPDIRELWR